MPACPCIHLQDALPAVRPISAYPPHCHGQKKESGLETPNRTVTEGAKTMVNPRSTHHTGELTAALRVRLLWVA